MASALAATQKHASKSVASWIPVWALTPRRTKRGCGRRCPGRARQTHRSPRRRGEGTTRRGKLAARSPWRLPPRPALLVVWFARVASAPPFPQLVGPLLPLFASGPVGFFLLLAFVLPVSSVRHAALLLAAFTLSNMPLIMQEPLTLTPLPPARVGMGGSGK
jgi:hypothetical protein